MVYWATESVPYTGMFDTGMARARAASTSTTLYPVAITDTKRKLGSWANVSAVSGTLLVKITSASAARCKIRSSGVVSWTANSPNAETGSQGLSPGFRVCPSSTVIFIEFLLFATLFLQLSHVSHRPVRRARRQCGIGL